MEGGREGGMEGGREGGEGRGGVLLCNPEVPGVVM